LKFKGGHRTQWWLGANGFIIFPFYLSGAWEGRSRYAVRTMVRIIIEKQGCPPSKLKTVTDKDGRRTNGYRRKGQRRKRTANKYQKRNNRSSNYHFRYSKKVDVSRSTILLMKGEPCLLIPGAHAP